MTETSGTQKVSGRDRVFAAIAEALGKHRDLLDNALKADLVQPHIIRGLAVKYAAGSSPAGDSTYVDSHVPQRIQVIDLEGQPQHIAPDLFLNVHEHIERKLMVERKLSYEDAHPIAQRAENAAVRASGIDPKSYEKALRPYIRHAEHENLVKERHVAPVYTGPYDAKDKQAIERAERREHAEGNPGQRGSAGDESPP